jgi:hypothetical protein
MSEQEQLNKVMNAVMDRSEHCERGLIAVTEDGRGLAMVGPDCILYAQIFHPALPPFDFCLN